jgi:2-polyprenyl-6-hydroxyphenyl methylase/3-demethylubiquinone-9 3-methyltransferase
MSVQAQRNADDRELAMFDGLAERWWDPKGEMGPLHVINPVRMRYIASCLGSSRPGSLKGLRVLDVGCGGGILSEALARAGAKVTGIDLAGEALAVARAHAETGDIKVDYRQISAEALAEEMAEAFDLVCCLEMLEHVPDPEAVVEACARLVRPGGSVVFSTINRNPKAFLLAIVAAEHVLRLIPRGTHEYAKLIRPSELSAWARDAGLQLRDLRGLRYNPLLRAATLSSDVDVNYLLHAVRP